MRASLTFTGATLVAGGAAALTAAFLPALYPVWLARGADALMLIGQHRGAWQWANWLFGVGTGLTVAGLAALTTLALIVLASTLWTASLAFRLTVTVSVADAASAGHAAPDWYEPVNAWVGALWYAAALLGAAATIGYGLTVRGADVLPGWTGWLAIAVGVFMFGLFAVTRDVPPVLLYLAPTAFGVTALIRAAA
jgi:hypothetical protein